MTRRLLGSLRLGLGVGVVILPLALAAGAGLPPASEAYAAALPSANGVVKVKSLYGFDETITRLKADIAKKGIMFFSAIDQASLAQSAGIKLLPSTLLIFGNPPLGIQFLTSKPEAGLDWPVRLLVTEDAKGQVWAVYSDFGWIARRHKIKDRDAAFKMASEVIASITSSVAPK
ncbi:MAG: DUF302 domain-containing protein [Beijerinckiaceae bacterium]|nr:DUF302 domain-containing protein [Beijerinckiaceae bacterium]MCI0737005.1 DUF302 domain-containing protein [Beijerinckiaceae bacterium]